MTDSEIKVRVAELIEKCKKLYEQNKDDEIVTLLDDKILTLYKSAALYTERGRSLGNLGKPVQAIQNCDIAIDNDPTYAAAFNCKGVCLYDLAKYDEALVEYNKAIELNPNFAKAYLNRGNILYDKQEYDQAIQDYDRVIMLQPNDAETYSYRGVTWAKKYDYDNAILDCNKAIELKPDYADAYYNRATVWDNLTKYNNAIHDYDRAIELKPNDAEAYFAKGTTLTRMQDYDTAIQYYNKAIELKPNFASAYNNRGVLWEDYLNYDKAIEDFEKAIELDSSFALAIRNKERILTIQGEEYEKIAADSYDLFNDAVRSLELLIKSTILNKCKSIMEDIIDKIRAHAYSDMDKELEYPDEEKTYLAAHYTKLKVTDQMISYQQESKVKNKIVQLESKLRYYNAVYMNDPEEGQIILQCLKEHEHDKEIYDAFVAGSKEEENSIYLGSFLPARLHEDELIMWRTYGKDENKTEAAGCSIIIDSDFFDKEQKLTRLQKMKSDSTIDDAIPDKVQPLVRVIYFDKNEGAEQRYVTKNGDCELIEEDMKRLVIALKELIALKNENQSEEKNIAINKIVYLIISEIRYFFKSADYAFENEVRVVQFMPSENEKVKIDDNGGQWLPRRLYIESNKPILPYIRKIILGPKVPNPNQWLYLEAMMKKKGYNIKLQQSKQRFQ